MKKHNILNIATFVGLPADIFWKLEKALKETVTEAELKAALKELGAARWHSQMKGLLKF